MATNKFATMLRKNTNRMAVILVYALLEWILIALLLLNGLFSYLIGKFADFFGLKHPCLLCSRVDHLFEAGRRRNAYRDLLCEAHAAEVSRMGYCSNHRRLADASDMCEDCSSSRSVETDRAVALLTWMKRSDEGEKDLRCSCCGVMLESGFYSPYLLLKPSSWGVLDYARKGNLVEETAEDRERSDKDAIFDQEIDKKVTLFDQESVKEEKMALFDGGDTTDEKEKEADMGALISEPEAEQEQEGEFLLQFSETCLLVEDASLEVLSRRVEKETDEERLFPSELIDSITMKSYISYKIDRDDGELGNDVVKEDASAFESRSIAEEKLAWASTMEKADAVEVCYLPPAGEPGGDLLSDHQQCAVPPEITAPVSPQDNVDAEVEASAALEAFAGPQAYEEETKLVDMEANCEISRGSEICDPEHIDQGHFHELIPLSVGLENRCSESYNEATDKDQATETGRAVTVAQSVDRLSISAELNEVEEERELETPAYIDGIHGLHKRFVFERREFGTESVDGSVASEIEGIEPLTIDHLKSALKAERKALNALYAELEEERSASAIAANQTMAMITRLQGEKAAMQMEALQYQRMMEEQSEYDQEALQLMNELMKKREKEKQDLETELEVCRKKVLLYEAKERRRLARSNNKTSVRSGTSSASSSAEDSDDLSFDFHDGDEGAYSPSENNQNTPTDAIFGSGTDRDTAKHLITLDETSASFEEERLSILEQLKALEEKLFFLDDEVCDNVKAMEHLSEENGHATNANYESLGDEVHDDVLNGFSDDLDTKDKHHCEQRTTACKRKRLLPLFDAASVENEGELCTRQEVTDASIDSVSRLSKEQMKLAIVEEVDDVYERLQALEADREFLKHCISSLKLGDKGMDLLQEILQHLRDLKSVELRVRNADDAFALP